MKTITMSQALAKPFVSAVITKGKGRSQFNKIPVPLGLTMRETKAHVADAMRRAGFRKQPYVSFPVLIKGENAKFFVEKRVEDGLLMLEIECCGKRMPFFKVAGNTFI
jgi:phage replication-related protein YjqB (UPF0714/DUF867 family)